MFQQVKSFLCGFINTIYHQPKVFRDIYKSSLLSLIFKQYLVLNGWFALSLLVRSQVLPYITDLVVFYVVIDILWSIPMYLLCLILNAIWYQQMMKSFLTKTRDLDPRTETSSVNIKFATFI